MRQSNEDQFIVLFRSSSTMELQDILTDSLAPLRDGLLLAIASLQIRARKTGMYHQKARSHIVEDPARPKPPIGSTERCPIAPTSSIQSNSQPNTNITIPRTRRTAPGSFAYLSESPRYSRMSMQPKKTLQRM